MRRRKLSWLVGAAVMLTACSGSAEPALSIMGTDGATLPAWVSESEGLPLEQLTHVGDTDDFIAFASRDSEGGWCLVLALRPTRLDPLDFAVGASCAPAESFVEQGVTVAVVSSSRRSEALLLPDDFNGSKKADWERVNDNLAVRH